MENWGNLLGRSDIVLYSSQIPSPHIPKPDYSLLMTPSEELVVLKAAMTLTTSLTRFYHFPLVVQGNLQSGRELPLPMTLLWLQRTGFFFISFILLLLSLSILTLLLNINPWTSYIKYVPVFYFRSQSHYNICCMNIHFSTSKLEFTMRLKWAIFPHVLFLDIEAKTQW